jgi:hypothetical protein
MSGMVVSQHPGAPRPETRRSRPPGTTTTAWAQLMARRRRKTLVVCQTCHDTIHAGQPTPKLTQ